MKYLICAYNGNHFQFQESNRTALYHLLNSLESYKNIQYVVYEQCSDGSYGVTDNENVRFDGEYENWVPKIDYRK